MIRKIPIIASSASFRDFSAALSAAGRTDAVVVLEDTMRDILGPADIFCLSSGIASFYVILKALLRVSPEKNEVFVPAYTAGSLIAAIRKAGLCPRLYDLEPADYNGELGAVPGMVSARTLAVVAVHMFGIGSAAVKGLRKNLDPGIAVIEDCCQAMGSSVDGQAVGNCSEISFFSFNRGKPVAVYAGGCIVTRDQKLADIVKAICRDEVSLPRRKENCTLPLKTLAFMIASRPGTYGLAYFLRSWYQSRSVASDFPVTEMTAFQALLASRLAGRIKEITRLRQRQGFYLAQRLKDAKGVRIPVFSEKELYNLTRFPVIVENAQHIPAIQQRLWKEAGIETSRLYERPLHHMFDLGYRGDDFPNACFFADHLLTLPVHAFVSRQDLDAMADIISRPVKG